MANRIVFLFFILVTHINIVPPIALGLLRYENSDVNFLTVRYLINAAAPLEQRVASHLSQKTGCAVTQWYGMTEASPSSPAQISR